MARGGVPGTRRGLGVVAAALAGFVVGYFIGVYAGCDWLYPTSNLCGIYGALLTGPVGAVCGAVGVWRMTRSGRTSTRGRQAE